MDYFADAWINGYYLGFHEGFFNHFTFDVSRWVRAGENLLVVRVESPKDANVKVGPTEKTVVKGALQDWDNNLDVNPGGIFAEVRLIESHAIAAAGAARGGLRHRRPLSAPPASRRSSPATCCGRS